MAGVFQEAPVVCSVPALRGRYSGGGRTARGPLGRDAQVIGRRVPARAGHCFGAGPRQPAGSTPEAVHSGATTLATGRPADVLLPLVFKAVEACPRRPCAPG